MPVRFGEFELDPASHRLSRGDEDLAVEPLVLELLAYLVENRGRIVGKDELLRTVWQGRHVSDAVLAKSIHGVRAALGESADAGDEGFIRTIRGRGYRFDGEVERVSSSGESRRRRRGVRRTWWVAGALLAGALLATWWWWSDRPLLNADADGNGTLVLLPVINATGEEDKHWIELGLMDLVSSRLARVTELDVVSAEHTLRALATLEIDPGSAIADEDLERIRRSLGAAWLVSGVLTRRGGVYRLETSVHGAKKNTVSRAISGTDPIALAGRLVALLAGGAPPAVASTSLRSVAPETEQPTEALAYGVHELLAGNHASARTWFESVLDRDPDHLEARYRLAVTLERLGEWEAGLELVRKLLADSEGIDAGHLRAPATRLLGLLHQHRGEYVEARRAHERALDLFEAAGDVRGRIDSHTDLGVVALQLSDWQASEQHYAQARAQCEGLEDRTCLADVLHGLGVLAGRRGQLEEADEHFARELELRRQLGDRYGEARALHNLASNAHNRGDWSDGETKHRTALQLRRQLGDRNAVAGSLVNLAVINTWRGRLARAESDALEAIEIFEALGNRRGLAYGLYVRAYVALGRRRYAAAAELCERALALWEELGVGRRRPLAWATLAEISSQAGDASLALSQAETAHRLARESGDPNLLAYSLRALGLAERVAGQSSRARSHFTEALRVAREVGNEGIEGSIATDLADLLLEIGRSGEAAPLVARLTERLPESGEVALLEARLHLAAGRPAEAHAASLEAKRLAHELWSLDDEAVLERCRAAAGPRRSPTVTP